MDCVVESGERSSELACPRWFRKHRVEKRYAIDTVHHDAGPTVDVDEFVHGRSRNAGAMDLTSSIERVLHPRPRNPREVQLEDRAIRPGEDLGGAPFSDEVHPGTV